ncbi:MAG: oligosaccharyl transferase, archaeosortase A system-associated [Planctomycetes bacterium]|nr:oligosaccharyl transferase, archaeosortase A system-associated [Planctomycetota bacterium]
MVTLALICIGAFLLRTLPVMHTVFPSGEVVYLESDPWYHVRLIESCVANFPHLNRIDLYGQYPHGEALPVAPLFDWLLAAASLVIGLGRPSARTVELVCAWAPPALGSLGVLATYFVGRRILHRTAGLLAAAMLAVMPSNFFAFSMLGYTDHHVAEVLFSTLTMLGIAGALINCEGNTRSAIRWKGAMLAGVALTAYSLAWVGAAMFIAIAGAWFVVQVAANHLRRFDNRNLAMLALVTFGVPLPFVLLATACGFSLREHCLALGGAVVAIPALCLISRAMIGSRRGRLTFPLVIVAGAAGAITLFAAVSPTGWGGIVSQMRRFNVGGGALQLVETTPLLRGISGFSLAPAYEQFTTATFIAIPALALLAIQTIRRAEPGRLLLLVWSIAMIAATLGQRRFAYYSAVSIALLTAYLVFEIHSWLSRRITSPTGRRAASIALAMIVVAALLVPNLPASVELASTSEAPNADWRETLAWVRTNTPEPMGDAGAYLARYDPPSDGSPVQYPTSAYSIMNWWDYGYWIVRGAKRMPVSNPTQHCAHEAATFFLAKSEAEAGDIARKFGARYILVDALMGFLPGARGGASRGKFAGVIAWAGARESDYFEKCYERSAIGRWRPVTLFYPACHETLYSRLYIFRGKTVTPSEAWAVRIVDETDTALGSIRVLKDSRQFTNHADAAAFIAANAGYRLASRTPFNSCVPLPPLRGYRLLHQSPTAIGAQFGNPIGYVEVYEIQSLHHNGDQSRL